MIAMFNGALMRASGLVLGIVGTAACGDVGEGGGGSSGAAESSTGGTGELLDEPIDAPPAVNEVGEAGPLWRLDLRLSAGVVELASTSTLTIAAGGRPAPAFGSTHVVIAYAGEERREVVLASFPTGMHAEQHQIDGTATHTISATEDSMTAVFLRADPEVDRIEVRDVDGVLSLGLGDGELPSLTPFRANSPFAQVPHVEVWTKSDVPRLPKKIAGKYGDKVVGASARMLKITEAALQAAPPLARKAVATVVYYSDPISESNALVNVEVLGNTMFINVAAAEALIPNEGYEALPSTFNLITTIIHESIHNAQSLLNSAGNGASLWDDAVRQEAVALLERYYIDPSVGVTDTWDAIHSAAVDAERATAYTSQFKGLGHDAIVAGGFMSARGAAESFEDMAEYAAEATLPACLDASNCEKTRRDHACQAMRAAKEVEPFPVEFAIHYAKLAMLRRLTLLTPAHFERCVGEVKLRITTPGIELNKSAHFDLGLRAVLYESFVFGWDMFAVLGQLADGYELLIDVPASSGMASALGIHRIQNSYLSEPAGLYLQNRNLDKTASRKAKDGLVFFEEISSTRVRGAVFFLQLDGPFGNTELNEFVPILLGSP